ncbi:uncharacterized protein tacc2 isoform X2 [Triplophysa rosa]|uniref:uncharacterized protein tacc2 isoform X2 n=1 Tax=Triplophysa rosa TaxID=992332 RepID=UPI002546263C|nr:uncharacterized protein tacc2 isoform X2 [Triplophysa rosa]
MGNEISTQELPEVAPDNVVLFPPEETPFDSLSEAAVHADKVSPENEKSNGGENGSVHTDTTAAEPQVSDEEDKQRKQEEEDKDELEFPHDLLPSIDLSTELNLTWGTSLGSEQVSSDDMKNGTVAQNGTANPLLAGLQHYMEASPPVVGLMKSCDADQVCTASPSEPEAQLSSTALENVPSFKPLDAVDYELEEAFKECENQMAVLGMSSFEDTWTPGDVDRCCSVALPDFEEENKQIEKIEVKTDAGLSSHKLEESHEGCHGSDGAHKNDSLASDEEVFSFRDYVLGKKETNTGAVRTDDIVGCVTENYSEESSQVLDSEQQIKPETIIDKGENIPNQELIDSRWTGTQTISEKQTLIQYRSIQDVCSVKYTQEAESTEGFKDSDRIYFNDPRATQEANPVNEELMSSDAQIHNSDVNVKIDPHSHFISDSATLTDKHTCETLFCLEPKIITQPNIQKHIESGTQRQSKQKETNTEVESISNHQRKELVLPKQLSAEGKQPICFPSPEPDTHLAHLSQSGAPPVLIRHSPEVLEQHDDRDGTDGPCESISDGEKIHHNHGSIGEVKHEKNVSVASAVVIDFGRTNSACEHEPTGSRDLLEWGNGPPSGSRVDVLTPVRGNSHSLSRAGAGEEEEEIALEQISAEFAGDTWLRGTPTRLEKIECEGEKRGDAYRSAAERESAVIISDLLQADEILKSERTQSEITVEQEQKCIIFPQISSSPVQRVEEKVESCDSRMPHNSSESEEKGGGLPIVLSPVGDDNSVSVGAEDKTPVIISSAGVLGTCERKAESSRSTERKGEEEGTEEEGKGGAQTVAHAETCTSHSITALATQSESHIIPGVTDDASSALTIKRTNDCDSINPPHPPSHLNTTEREAQREGEACLNRSPSASGDDLTRSDRSPPPALSSESEALIAQASDQQVQSASQTGDTNGDTPIKTETQQQTQAVSPTSFKPQPDMKNINEMAVNLEGLASKSNRSFGDQKDKMLKCQMTECASLPPLMVFEKLRHPVKETSFNFEGFLNTNKPPPTPGQPQNKEGDEPGAKNKPVVSEEKENKEHFEKQEEKKQVEIICNELKDCREEGKIHQEQNESTEDICVKMGSSDKNGEVTETIKNHPVIPLSHPAAGESISISNTKPVHCEILKEVEKSNEKKQENAEYSNVTQISPKVVNESASTDKNSDILQDVSLQENRSCEDSTSVDYVGSNITVFDADEQKHTEVLLTTTEMNDEKCILTETGDIEKTSQEHKLNPEQHACEDEPQVKTTSMSSEAAFALDTDSTDLWIINTMCLSQPNQKSNTEQPATTSEMQILPTADEYTDKLPCQTESQLNDEIMTSAALDADDKTVPSPAVETSVPAQRDPSSNSTQSTTSDARDVSVIVLRTPGPLLSHCKAIIDGDIALAGAGKHCSVDSVCDSHTDVVKDIKGDVNDQQCNTNEEMVTQNADDPSHTVGVSMQEIAASCGSRVFTADRPEEGCGSLLGSKSPEIDENAKDIRELDVFVEGKKDLNSEHEEDLSGVSMNSITVVGTIVQDKQNSQSHLCDDTFFEYKPPVTLLSDPPSGHVSSTSLGSELQSITNMQNSSIEPSSFETTCAHESLHSQCTSTTQKTPSEDIKCDLRVAQSGPHTPEEPALHVSSDDKEIIEGTTEGFMPVIGGEENKKCIQEPQGRKQISCALSEFNDFKEVGNQQNNRKESAMKEQAEKTCRKQEDNKDDAHTFQEQDETTVKPGEHVDETEEQKQELIEVDVENDFSKEKQLHQTIKTEKMQEDNKDDAHTFQEQDEITVKPGENIDETEAQKQEKVKNDLSEEKQLYQTIQSKKMQSTPVSDSVVTSEGCMEEDLCFKEEPRVKTHPALSQSDLLFSQSQENHQQPMFMAASEVELVMKGTTDKRNSLANAEANNYADAEASEEQDKLIVCCTPEAQSSVNNKPESFTLLEGNKRGDIVDITCPQNEEQSVQTADLSGENIPFPDCGESSLRENTNLTEQVVKEENELVSLASENTENEDKEAKEEKYPPVLASQESESKLEECINSQNVWNEIPDAKKDSEQPVSHTDGFTECPRISHHEAVQKTEEQCFSSVTHGDTEIRPDSQNDVVQIQETSTFQPKEDSDIQPSDGQLSTIVTPDSASVLPENIKDEKVTSMDQDSKFSGSLGLSHPVQLIGSPKCSSESETSVPTIDQPNKYLSEQISHCTQNTEKQDTQCTKQQLTHLVNVDPGNKIGTVKSEYTVLKKTQQAEVNELKENEEENKTIGKKDHMEMSESAKLKSSVSVVEESRSKDEDNPSKLSVLLDEQSVVLRDGETISNVDLPKKIADETWTEIKQAAVNMTSSCPNTSVSSPNDSQDYLQLPSEVSQESSQQVTTSFVQSLPETATDMVNIKSDQNPNIADRSIEDIRSVSIKNTVQNLDIEAKEESSNVSEGEDGSLGSAQVSQVKNSLYIQCPGVISVPASSGTVNSPESSDWLRDLKEAAAMSHIIPEHRDETTCGSAENRPLGTLSSYQAEPEFKTPTEEGFPPLPESFSPEIEDNFPPVPESFYPEIEDSFPPVPEIFPPEIEDSFPPVPEIFPPEIEDSFPPVPEIFPPEIKDNFPPVPESFSFEIEENFPPVTEQPEEPSDCRPPITEAAERSEPVLCSPSPPPQHAVAPALPAHLLHDTEFPTPPPTPPERAPPEPPTLLSTSASPDLPETPPVAPIPHQIQQLQHCEPSARSSDSDGAFETPESTTPVKSAAPPVPPTEPPGTTLDPLSSEQVSTVDICASDDQNPDSPLPPPSRSPSTVFDEDKPIAASGAYNLDYSLTNDPLQESNFGPGQSRTPLTRSLSLQSGDLESPGDKSSEGADKPSHPRTESFSIGTESAPGTLRRVKKPRPGSLKKKPLSRQNSNPKRSSPKPVSPSSTPEEKKREKPCAESPLQTQERASASPSPSPSPSPAGTLRRNRIKSRVESPPPLAEEITPAPTSIAFQEVVDPVSEAVPVPDEDSPIPPCASYKWDPDNFDNIDPFCTGGSKIANSPVLNRKADFTSVSDPHTSTSVALEEPCPPAAEEPVNAEKQPIIKRQPVRLEFDYSEDSGEASHNGPPPKKLGKKPGAKMPIRKPKLGIKKAPPAQKEQLDNASIPPLSNDNDEIPIPKASYNFDPSKWDDPNFNPFSSASGVPNSPHLSQGNYSFDPDSFDVSADPFKPPNKIVNSPPKAASFDVSANDNENDNIVELEDHNLNKPAKMKKKPLKSAPNNFSSLCCFFNTFRVKKSPKRSPISEQTAQCCPVCSPLSPSTSHPHLHLQEHTPDANPDPSQDHATDEEKLASSTNQKWATRHEVEAELNSDPQDFPQPSDFTAFVNKNSLPKENDVTDYEIEYMEKIGTSAPSLSEKKPSLYLKLDSVTDSPKKSSSMQDSEPNSPCTGSFEEMEAQISQGKSPVLPPRSAREPKASEKNRKRESQPQSRTQSNGGDGASPIQGPMDPSDLPLLDRLSDSSTPLNYLEPDLAETNPTAFAQKLQEELVLASLRIEALQVAKNISQSPSLSTVSPQSRLKKPIPHRWNLNGCHMAKKTAGKSPQTDIKLCHRTSRIPKREMASPGDSGVSKSSLYSRAGYSEGESPHLPHDMDHSLGIAREEIVVKEKEALEWKRKYEESRREVEEMRRIVMEYEKTIAEMIEKSCVPLDANTEGEQREKNLSHHTIQQLILEKDQALADLNSVEKSLADLFRRYEKMKDVLEGFRKNEEVLKKCAQEYLSRVRKEEQRYHALKIHAEEKLDKANADIAQVRTKAKQEQAANQASLRKEQMKVDSLERTLEQKNKEIEELTKICDELIAKMGKS